MLLLSDLEEAVPPPCHSVQVCIVSHEHWIRFECSVRFCLYPSVLFLVTDMHALLKA